MTKSLPSFGAIALLALIAASPTGAGQALVTLAFANNIAAIASKSGNVDFRRDLTQDFH